MPQSPKRHLIVNVRLDDYLDVRLLDLFLHAGGDIPIHAHIVRDGYDHVIPCPDGIRTEDDTRALLAVFGSSRIYMHRE